MAGSFAGFDKAAFREGILFAMGMARPNDETGVTRFRWLPVRTYNPQDADDQPLDWTASPVTENKTTDLEVAVAVQNGRVDDTENQVGSFDDSVITVVVLDEEYQALLAHGGRRPDQVVHGPKIYTIDWDGTPPPIGLFDEDVRLIVAVRSPVR